MDKRKSQSEIECSRFEALLAEAMEGQLPEDVQQGFEIHCQSCSICGPMFAEAQEGMAWLRDMEEVEPPKNLVHNILAATSLAAAAEQQQAKAWGSATGWLKNLWNSIRPIASGVAHPLYPSPLPKQNQKLLNPPPRSNSRQPLPFTSCVEANILSTIDISPPGKLLSTSISAPPERRRIWYAHGLGPDPLSEASIG